ncbi:DnaJ domain-containing protein [Mesorhizobium sp. BR1-1-16]|uniref:DnaJ domain-containing protein n=1 Tax=Mesorhizobium sp. BR1-1-16 TaxID=2876653 RepID=UPI001CCA6DE2|nr:J domain-containing protein [Mesorhizobium sp. BR1-1-16]MBZ9935868.1 DnaJ domain-containing protein [Mesorhizobium sp. BR1-1-16]
MTRHERTPLGMAAGVIEKKSLYSELSVSGDASASEIDKAYRRRARQAHPDAGGNAEAFHALAHAYAVLSDPDRRAAYDATGYEGEIDAETIAARAMDHIQQLVASVLESDIPFEQIDLVAAIRDTLANQKAEIAGAVVKLEAQAKRAEAMARRFRRGKGPDFIGAALDRRSAEAKQTAEKTRHEEAVFAKAITLLADYAFDHEPATPVAPASGRRTAQALK